MFNLESEITQWRNEMKAAGIKTSSPLEELEAHLRESIEQRVRGGMSEQCAFENAVAEMGQPQALQNEFQKNGGSLGKMWATFLVLAGFIMIGRVLIARAETGNPVWKEDQMGWIFFSMILMFWGANTLIFRFTLGDSRELRLWKVAGLTYSMLTAWLAVFPMLRLMQHIRFNMVEMVVAIIVTAAAFLSVPGWRYFRGVLPVIHSRRKRTLIGIAGCLLAPVSLAIFFVIVWPRWGHFPAQFLFVLMPCQCALMALLGGVGYGLAEAARNENTTATA